MGDGKHQAAAGGLCHPSRSLSIGTEQAVAAMVEKQNVCDAHLNIDAGLYFQRYGLLISGLSAEYGDALVVRGQAQTTARLPRNRRSTARVFHLETKLTAGRFCFRRHTTIESWLDEGHAKVPASIWLLLTLFFFFFLCTRDPSGRGEHSRHTDKTYTQARARNHQCGCYSSSTVCPIHAHTLMMMPGG